MSLNLLLSNIIFYFDMKRKNNKKIGHPQQYLMKLIDFLCSLLRILASQFI